MGQWEHKGHHTSCPWLPPFFPQLYMLGMIPYIMVWNIPLVYWSHLSWMCPLAAPCAPTGCCGWEQEKALALCQQCSAAVKTSMLSTLLSGQVQNTSPHRLLWKKLTLPQPKPAQSSETCSHILARADPCAFQDVLTKYMQISFLFTFSIASLLFFFIFIFFSVSTM